MSALYAFLMSPLRVMAAGCRIVILLCAAAPLAFGRDGLFLTLLALFFWPMFALVLYGPRDMVYDREVPMRTWLWRHVEMWWHTPGEES
jgi:hypothetical protein